MLNGTCGGSQHPSPNSLPTGCCRGRRDVGSLLGRGWGTRRLETRKFCYLLWGVAITGPCALVGLSMSMYERLIRNTRARRGPRCRGLYCMPKTKLFLITSMARSTSKLQAVWSVAVYAACSHKGSVASGDFQRKTPSCNPKPAALVQPLPA